MREERPAPDDPGHVAASLVWPADTPMPSGARVEATDGVVGTLRERIVGSGPEPAYLGVETPDGLLFVPERLIREVRGETVMLSLPLADVTANSSPGQLPLPGERPPEPG